MYRSIQFTPGSPDVLQPLPDFFLDLGIVPPRSKAGQVGLGV